MLKSKHLRVMAVVQRTRIALHTGTQHHMIPPRTTESHPLRALNQEQCLSTLLPALQGMFIKQIHKQTIIQSTVYTMSTMSWVSRTWRTISSLISVWLSSQRTDCISRTIFCLEVSHDAEKNCRPHSRHSEEVESALVSAKHRLWEG